MPPSEKRGKVYHSQARTIISSVLQYFERERDNKGPLKDVKKVVERVSEACQVSIRTVGRIKAELKSVSVGADTSHSSDIQLDLAEATEQEAVAVCNHSTPVLQTPKKKKHKQSRFLLMDDFDRTAIRRHVVNYYKNKEVPTLRKLQVTLREASLFSGSLRTLSKLLKNLNFRWKKLNKRKLLMEKPSIALSRCRFLRKMKNVDMKNVVFLDETWLNANSTKEVGWTDDKADCNLNAPLGKGKRLIICHAGGYRGWINSPPLIFESKKTVDFHEEMNHEVFEGWFFEVLLKSIPAGSTIVMDNAPYHSRVDNPAPTTSSRKGEYVDWLHNRGIPFTPDMRKPELYNLIKLHKPQLTSYVIDKKAADLGFRVIRLPPYHCNYNPIEMVWGHLKRYVASKNTTFKLSDVQTLFMEAVNSYPPETWEKCVNHVKTEMDDDWLSEGLDDTSVQELIINLAPGDSDVDDSDWDSDEEDDLGVAQLE